MGVAEKGLAVRTTRRSPSGGEACVWGSWWAVLVEGGSRVLVLLVLVLVLLLLLLLLLFVVVVVVVVVVLVLGGDC